MRRILAWLMLVVIGLGGALEVSQALARRKKRTRGKTTSQRRVTTRRTASSKRSIRSTKVDLPPPMAAHGLLFGMNVRWFAEDFSEAQIGTRAFQSVQLLKEAGVTNVRVPLRWMDVEPTQNQYQWATTDRLLRFLHDKGFTLVCTVTTTPRWAQDNDPALEALLKEKNLDNLRPLLPPKPEFYPDFARFALRLGQRYRGVVQRWEFGEEPDGKGFPTLVLNALNKPTSLRFGDAEAYTRLLQIFYSNIKRADTSFRVAVGGLAVPNAKFLEALYQFGGRNAFDAVALQPKSEAKGVNFEWIDACRNLLVLRDNAEKPFWITAWGWSVYPQDPAGAPVGQQARLVREALQGMKSRAFIEQACYLSLMDDRTGYAGLCDLNLKPRLAYSAFQGEQHSGLPPLNPFRRVPMMGEPTAEMVLRAVHIQIETARKSETLPKLGRGVSPAFARRDSLPDGWEKIAPLLSTEGANLLRLAPLSGEDSVILSEKGEWVVNWAKADALLESAAKQGANILFCLAPPPKCAAERWRDLVSLVVKRYGTAPKFGVIRWEMQAFPDQISALYPAFAETVLRLLPSTPIGIYAPSGNAMETLERAAEICAQKRLSFHSFAWRMEETPEREARRVRDIRSLLSRYPVLQTTRLLPEMAKSSVARLCAYTLRLLDYAPQGEPNELLSLLAEGIGAEGGAEKALFAWNRMSGSRLNARSDDSEIGSLAVMTPEGSRVLLWNERAEESRLVYLQFAHLGRAGGRAYRYRLFRLSEPNVPIAISDAPREALELPILLRGDEPLLLEVAPLAKPNVEVSLEVPRFSALSGNSMEVAVTVKNLTRSAVPLELELESSLPGMIRGEASRLVQESLPAGVERTIRYALPIPTTFKATTVYLNVTANRESHAAVIFQAETPVRVTLEKPFVDLETPGGRGVATLRVQNQGLVPIFLSFKPAFGGITDLQLPKLSEQTPFAEVMAPTLEAGNYRVPLSVESLGDRLEVLAPIVRVPLLAKRALSPLTLDGDLGEWEEAKHVAFNSVEQVYGKPWRGAEDLSGWGAVQWDAQYLYLAFEVKDDFFVQNAAASELWKGDSVQVAVSGNRSGAWDQLGYVTGEHEFTLALLNGQTPTLVRSGGVPFSSGESKLTPQIAIKRKGAITCYEAAIPWEQVSPLAQKAGLVFGIALWLNDEDGSGRGTMDWNGVLTNGIVRPGRFPSLRLSN